MYRIKFIHGVYDISLNTHILFRSICLIKKALNATELDWATFYTDEGQTTSDFTDYWLADFISWFPMAGTIVYTNEG